jgi:glutathione peroxidase
MGEDSTKDTELGYLTRLMGGSLPLSSLRGKVVLIVNVASRCSHTGQYASLQRLCDRHRRLGLLVLGVPCNQFGDQEPEAAPDIAMFCKSRYRVTFPILAKQDVNGPLRSALYCRLVSCYVGSGRDVAWNFEKFLVGRDGRVIERFGTTVDPGSPEVGMAVNRALNV